MSPASGPSWSDSWPTKPPTNSSMTKAYNELATEPGAWVSLTDLRSMFPNATRAEFDQIVKGMDGKGATVIPEANQKTLTQADRDAAVNIGGEANHLIQIGTAR